MEAKMTFKLFLESENSRIDVSVTGDWNHRVFFESQLKDKHKNFLQTGEKIQRGEATVDLNVSESIAYINRIDAYPKNQRFGSELLEFILDELKKKGFKIARAYIEDSNPDSRMLFKKFKFVESEKNKSGSYWEKQL